MGGYLVSKCCKRCGFEAQMAVDLTDLTWKLGLWLLQCTPSTIVKQKLGFRQILWIGAEKHRETQMTHEIWNPALLAQIISTWPIPACYSIWTFFLDTVSKYLMKRKNTTTYSTGSLWCNWFVHCLWCNILDGANSGIGQRLEFPGRRAIFCLWKAQLFIARCGDPCHFLWRVGAGSQNVLIRWSDQFAKRNGKSLWLCDFFWCLQDFLCFVLWTELDLCGWRGFDFFSLWT